MRGILVALALGLCAGQHAALAAKILGLFPHLGHSHFVMFRALLEALHERGHRLTVVSHFPRSEAVANYTDISLKGLVQDVNNNLDFGIFEHSLMTYLPFAPVLQLYLLLEEYRGTYGVPAFRELLESGGTFDLVLTEAFNTDAFLAVPYKLGVPFVGLSTCGSMPWGADRIGYPDHPAYFQGTFSVGSHSCPLLRRVRNAYGNFAAKLLYSWLFQPFSQRIAEEYFGPLPPLSEIAKNTSLILSNTHFTLTKARPTVPAFVEVSGLHIRPPSKLPQDLEQLLNESTEGVVYFSMGSLLRGETMPIMKREAFIKVFASLKQRVLWKWEGDDIPGKPDNVFIFKWIPQRDVLEHPNVVLYVAHGGLFGLTEAAYCGVPVVGLPVFGDQAYNVQNMVDAGVAVKVDFGDLCETSLKKAIDTVLNNSEYKENAKLLSERYRDRQTSAIDTAVYWTEYVIRHKGAPHLRSTSVDVPWYQYLLLDVIATIILLSASVLIPIYYFIKVVLYVLLCKWQRKEKQS